MNIPLELKSKGLYIKAKSLENLKKESLAEIEYSNLVSKYPFYEKGILAYGDLLTRKGETTKAYNIIVEGVKALKNSVELNKKYIMLCLEESLTDYATESIIELEKLMDQKDFATFKSQYDTQLAEIEAKFNEWE